MINLSQVSKSFKLYDSPADRLKELIFRRTYHRRFQALQAISFNVKPGETLGIIGRNGAGKSTLLKLLTGVLIPDHGEISIAGRITGLLELGTGFNYEFTGYDNIFLNGTYLGLSRADINRRLDSIIDFSELNEFINEPLKTYSSGMVMRLAFATAIHADPKAFVVDEALSVGDAYFQHKCINKIREFRENGGAIVFVSHDLNAVKILCDRAILLEKGEILEIDEPENIINSYNYLIAKFAQGSDLKKQTSANTSDYGNLQARIENVFLKNDAGAEVDVFISGQPAHFELHISSDIDISDLTLGILIRDKFGQDIFGTNTFQLNFPLQMEVNEKRILTFKFPSLNLGPGKYSLTAAIHTQDTHLDNCFHWLDKAISFVVVHHSDYIFAGICRMVPSIKAAVPTINSIDVRSIK